MPQPGTTVQLTASTEVARAPAAAPPEAWPAVQTVFVGLVAVLGALSVLAGLIDRVAGWWRGHTRKDEGELARVLDRVDRLESRVGQVELMQVRHGGLLEAQAASSARMERMIERMDSKLDRIAPPHGDRA